MCLILFFIFAIIFEFPLALSMVEDDFLLVETLSAVYNYDSVILVLDSWKTDNLTMFMKTGSVKKLFIELKEDRILPTRFFEKKDSVFISLLKEDESTFQLIDSALHANPDIFSETIWFVKVKQKDYIVSEFGNT